MIKNWKSRLQHKASGGSSWLWIALSVTKNQLAGSWVPQSARHSSPALFSVLQQMSNRKTSSLRMKVEGSALLSARLQVTTNDRSSRQDWRISSKWQERSPVFLRHPSRLQAVKAPRPLCQTRCSPLISPRIPYPPVTRWMLCSALSVHLTSPLHQLHHSQLKQLLHRPTYSSLWYSHSLAPPQLLPNRSPVGSEVLKNHFPISFPPSSPHSYLVHHSCFCHFHLPRSHSLFTPAHFQSFDFL